MVAGAQSGAGLRLCLGLWLAHPGEGVGVPGCGVKAQTGVRLGTLSVSTGPLRGLIETGVCARSSLSLPPVFVSPAPSPRQLLPTLEDP